jgi:hypothetical protein
MAGVVGVPRQHERPDPPAGVLAPAAAAIWRDVVARMRPRWFSRETHEQLARYCNAMVECHRLETALAGADVESTGYDRISKQLNAAAARALGYARALRITPLSNRENKIDGRDRARSLYPKAWEGDGPSDAAPPSKPWDD